MEKQVYFVTYNRHNATTDGWAYKTELKTESLDEAKKKWHQLMSENMDTTTFDHVAVMIHDAYNRIIEHDEWDKKDEENVVSE